MSMVTALSQAAWWVALLPVLVLVSLHQSGRPREAVYWWVGVAFAVSWVADALAHVVDSHITSLVYPLVQSAIIGAVLLRQRDALELVLVAVGAGLLAVCSLPSYDVLLRTVAWAPIAYLAWHRPERDLAGFSLVISFGLGLVFWYGYNVAPSFDSWAAYQFVRAVGLLAFGAACCQRVPTLRLADA